MNIKMKKPGHAVSDGPDTDSGAAKQAHGGFRFTIGMKISAGFAVVLAVFVVVGTLAHSNVTKLDENAGGVSHTYEVIDQVDEFMSGVVGMETGMRGFIITGDEAFLEPYVVGLAQADEHFERGRELTLDNAVQTARWNGLGADLIAIEQEILRLIGFRRDEGFDLAHDELIAGPSKSLMDGIRVQVDELAVEERALLGVRAQESADSADATRALILYGVIIAALAVVAIAVYLTRAIAKPIRRVAEQARQVAGGKISLDKLSIGSSDEIGDLGDAFDSMVESLKTMVTELQHSSEQLGTAAGSLTDVATSMGASAEQTSQQSSSASKTGEEVSSSVGAVAAAIEQLNASIREVSTSASEASHVSSEAVEVAKHTSATIGKLGESSVEIGRSVEEASRGTQEISDIINDVAEAAESTKKSTEQTSSSAEQMTQVASGLNELVGQYS